MKMNKKFVETNNLLLKMGIATDLEVLSKSLTYSEKFATYAKRIDFAVSKLKSSFDLHIDNVQNFVKFFDDSQSIKVPDCELYLAVNLLSQNKLSVNVPVLNKAVAFYDNLLTVGDSFHSNFTGFTDSFSSMDVQTSSRKKFDDSLLEALKKDIFV